MSSVDKQIEKEYSPRFWSKRLPENLILDNHITQISKASNRIKSEIPNSLNIQYGKKPTNLLDIFGIELDKDSPIFVYIHGGYWQILSKNENSYVAKPFWKSKIKTYVPDYDLVPEVTLQEIVEEIKIMATYVLKIGAENNVRNIWFGGHSAGAHLAATLLDENWLSSLSTDCRQIFKGLILISGIYDLLPLLKTENNIALKLNSSSALSLSPMHNANNLMNKSLLCEHFKILIAVAENDSPAFIHQSYTYYEKLKQVNFKVEYMLLKDLDHFDIVERLENDSFILSQQIISLMKTSKI